MRIAALRRVICLRLAFLLVAPREKKERIFTNKYKMGVLAVIVKAIVMTTMVIKAVVVTAMIGTAMVATAMVLPAIEATAMVVPAMVMTIQEVTQQWQ